MSHVDDAINEMFQATHMQMMRNCCRLEKMLLAAVLMESRARGQLLCCLCQANPMCFESYLCISVHGPLDALLTVCWRRRQCQYG